MGHSNKNWLIILIFLLALIIRLIFALPSTNIPSSDAGWYDRLGLSISNGRGFSNDDGTPHSFCPPFYSFFLAGIYKLFGHSYLMVRAIQSLLGAITCILIYLVANKVCNSSVGLWSAFISAVYPPFIKSAELLLTELFFTFLLLLIILYLLEVRKEIDFKKCAILGSLLGISLLTRPVMLLFPIFMVPMFIYLKKISFSKMLQKYLIVLLFFGLTVSPWVIRNYRIYHKFVPVSTHGGITLYSSYCPPGGIFGRVATIDDPVVAESKQIASPVLASNFLTKKTIYFILRNPAKVLRLEFKKMLYFWAPFDWEIIGGRGFNFIYVAALPFFAIGLLFAIRRFKFFYPILLPIGYIQIMSLIFYGSPRFRLPIEPYLFILAVIGVMVAGRYVSRKKGNGYEDICSNSSI